MYRLIHSLRHVLTLTLALSSIFCALAADARPNILFAIADDWSWPHAGVYGDTCVKTPTFDRIAKEGVLFKNSFCAAPSCTPSRAAVLAGRPVHALKDTGNLWSVLPADFVGYPERLEKEGYVIGLQGKGWAPGSIGDHKRNPAGPNFKSFKEFLDTVPKDKPFCFWYGSRDPHRPYVKDQGIQSGMKLEDVKVPPFLPDTPEVRGDILDYFFAVQRYDRDTGEMVKLLEERGLLDNTIVVMTSDNGMPFPRAKANVYDSGTHMPLAVRWPAKVKGGRVVEDFVSHCDFAPTFLDVAGLKAPPEMSGHSLLPLLFGTVSADELAERGTVYVERERHANVRKGDLSYPCRAIHTKDFLYIWNARPDRWPAGDPQMWKAVGDYGDIDDGPSKQLIMKQAKSPEIEKFARMALEKRPGEELFDLKKDPEQFFNVADDTQYAETKKKLRAQLEKWMKNTDDPRANGDTDIFDTYHYVTQPDKGK